MRQLSVDECRRRLDEACVAYDASPLSKEAVNHLMDAYLWWDRLQAAKEREIAVARAAAIEDCPLGWRVIQGDKI